MAFVATIEEPDDDAHHHQEILSPEGVDSTEAGPPQEDDDGLYIPSYLEEAIPDDPVLLVKMAHAMRALEKETRRCYKCNWQGHLQKDCNEVEEKTAEGPSSQRGLLKPNQRRRGRSQEPLSQVELGLWQTLQSERGTLSKSQPLLLVHRPQKLG